MIKVDMWNIEYTKPVQAKTTFFFPADSTEQEVRELFLKQFKTATILSLEPTTSWLNPSIMKEVEDES